MTWISRQVGGRQLDIQAIRQLIQFGHALRTRAGRRDVPSPLREDLLAASGTMMHDLRAVREGLRTPH